jgi:hypothetical protein
MSVGMCREDSGDHHALTTSDVHGAVTNVPISRGPIASLRIEIPEYLDRELAQRAFDQRVTKQYLVVQALQAAGFNVDANDLVPDKRKGRF